MPATLDIILPDLAATQALAARAARLARAGDALLLDGPLGAGKSAFARAFLRAAAGDPALEVPSPTFTLVQQYDLPGFRAHHFDLYRLGGPDGLDDLGWDEARDGVVLVEWPDRLGPHAPADALRLRLGFGDETGDEIGDGAGGGDHPDEDRGGARRARLRGWPGRLRALAGDGGAAP